MSRSKPHALHFGAGNIGRGFIGPLLAESGFHVVFSDVDKSVINQLNEYDSYHVYFLDGDNDGDKEQHSMEVKAVSGIQSVDEVIKHLSHPNVRLITTAVGPPVLEKIAPTIAKGLTARRKADAGKLNVVACENMIEQTAHLANFVLKNLSTDEDKSWVGENIGWANCSVDRIVPPNTSDEHDDEDSNPLDVGVEGFYEWVVDESLLKTPIEPPIKGMKLTTDLVGYIERKLFTLNCGHAITAYLGWLKNYSTIHEAIADEYIAKIVKGALEEGGRALVKKHNFDPVEHEAYVEKIMTRFANPALKDDVVRVGRQPLRKLGKKDRLLGPTTMALGYGMPIDNLAKGIAAALLYDVKDDKESVEVQEKVKSGGVGKAVVEIVGFQDGSPEHKKVVDAYKELKDIKVPEAKM